MLHADKSKSVPSAKPKASAEPAPTTKPDLKGKGLAEQEALLKPQDKPPAPSVPAPKEVAKPESALESAPKQVAEPEAPLEAPAETALVSAPKEVAKPEAPLEAPAETTAEPELSKKEQKAKAAEERKAKQLAMRETVRAEREERATKNAPSKKEQKLNEDAAKYGAQRETDKALWEVKVSAQGLLGRLTGADPLLAAALRTAKEAVEGVLADLAEKGADAKVLAPKVALAEKSYTDAMATTHKAREAATSGSTYMSGPVLTEALRYNDAALNEAYRSFKAAIDAGHWLTAKDLLAPAKAAFDVMKPHMTFFTTFFDKRLPWIRDKLGASADLKLATVMARVDARYALDAAGLKGLRNWLDSNFMGTIERPETEAEFEAVKGNDTNASAKLDELADKGVIRSGGLAKKYITSWDTGGGYSVEYTVQGVPQIVIHCHCEPSGSPKGGNASHWKLKNQKFSPGASHPVSKSLLDKFIDTAANKAAVVTRG